MQKRNFTWIAIVAFVIVIAIVFRGLQQHQRYQPENVLRSVPIEAPVVVRLNDAPDLIKCLNHQIDYKEELLAFESLRKLFELTEYLDSSRFFTRGPGEELINEPFYLSFHQMGKDRIEWTAHFGLEDKSHRQSFVNWMQALSLQKRDYTGFEIYEIKAQKEMPVHLFASIQDGVLSVSSSSLLIETVIRQQQSGLSLSDQALFNRVEKTTSRQAPGSLFVNFSYLPSILKPFFASNTQSSLPFWKQVAHWGVVDFEVKKDAVMLNGFLIDGEAHNSFVSIFKEVGVRRSQLLEVLPSNTRFLMSYNFSNGKVLLQNLKKYLNHMDDASNLELLRQKYEQATDDSYLDSFLGMIEGEFALAYTDRNPSEIQEGRYLVFRTKGQDRALGVMRQLQKYEGIDTVAVSYYRVDEATRFPIFRGASSDLSRAVWGHLFPDVPMKYFAFFRNYLVFANSPKSIEAFLYDNVLKRTLSNHAYYANFTENFSYEENFFLFAEIPHVYSFLGPKLNQGWFHPTDEQNRALGDFYGLGVQMSSTSDLNYTTLYASHAPHRDKEPRTIWQSRLDSSVVMKPVLVENHYTGEKEIMVQDRANHLYLMNNMGRILWKKKLDGPIISEIYQIDYYRNNKLQYLFNTRDKLYLLDRNGNHVAKYPFPLASKATNGLSVFDYDKNRDYRIFLALSDRRVYLFDKTGNRVSGWNIPTTEGTVTQPVQFFRTSGRDYIVFSDEYRNYVLDRKGDLRVTPQKNFVRASGNEFYLEYPNSDNAALVTSTRKGALAKIALPSGRTTIHQPLDDLGPHFFGLMPGNKVRYVFITSEWMQILDAQLKKRELTEFSKPMVPHADFYRFSADDLKLGVVSNDNNSIYLFNSNGSLYKGFPLKGTTRFSVGFLKTSAYRFNLVTGGDNNYLYNYRVE